MELPTAVITGASRGLGLALATRLAVEGWNLVVDARSQPDLDEAAASIDEAGEGRVIAIAGDVRDLAHDEVLVSTAASLGGFRLLVNNASTLGPSPLPSLSTYPLDELEAVYQVNVIAPLLLIQQALPSLRMARGQIVNVTSDAAVEAYEGWGGYGSAKAALEQASRVLAAEEPLLSVYWVDPGDMCTRMQQDAFPGEDITDRPSPETRVPGLMRLISGNYPSGRYRVSDLLIPFEVG